MKAQKIWLWIFVTMFALPEILWGDLLKIFRIPFIPTLVNINYFSSVFILIIIAIEIIGVFGVIFTLNRNNFLKNKVYKYLINILLFAILIMLILSLCFSFAINNMRIF